MIFNKKAGKFVRFSQNGMVNRCFTNPLRFEATGRNVKKSVSGAKPDTDYPDTAAAFMILTHTCYQRF